MTTFRPGRLGVMVAAAAAVSGCSSRRLGSDPNDASVTPPPARTLHYQANNRNVDLLFLVDDSSSMRLSQDNVMRNFPVLMTALRNQPGGLPNIHVAVISSDMGAGDGSIASCDSEDSSGPPPGSGGLSGNAGPDPTYGKKEGRFQYSARGTCTATGLDPGATFISDIDGVRNYTGNLEDVFTCIAALGEQGCGFEHQFAAITRAFGVDGLGAAPLENQGFLRPDAYLAIVLITDEDDCSAAPGVKLYDTGSNTDMASRLGPPANFRCNEFGHLCNGAPPNRNAPNLDVNATVPYDGCTSNETGQYLLGVRDTADRLRSLKADDGQILIAAITGPRAPYVVGWKQPSVQDTSCNASGQSCPWPVIQHSCTAADGNFADPAVRIGELADQFGENGRVLSICETDYSPALANIAGSVVAYVNEPCIMGRIATKPGTAHEDCTVVDNATGAAIPACADTGGTGQCWSVHPAGANACGGVSVAVQADPNGTDPAPLGTTVDCTLCAAGVSDPARGCP